MRLLKKHIGILKGLVKGKGVYKTKLIPKDKSIKEMETVVEMYLKGIITFENITELEFVGPTKEPQYKGLKIQTKFDTKQLKSFIRKGVYES